MGLGALEKFPEKAFENKSVGFNRFKYRILKNRDHLSMLTIQFFFNAKKFVYRDRWFLFFPSCWLSFSLSSRLSKIGGIKINLKTWISSKNFSLWLADSSSATRRIDLSNFTAAYSKYLVWHGDYGELYWWVFYYDCNEQGRYYTRQNRWAPGVSFTHVWISFITCNAINLL